MKKIFVFCLMALPLLISCSKTEYESFSTIYGIVSDSKTGEPISGVSVLLSPGGISKYTGSDGRYEFDELTPQQYTLTAQKPGYQTNRKSITAVVDVNTEGNITLTPTE